MEMFNFFYFAWSAVRKKIARCKNKFLWFSIKLRKKNYKQQHEMLIQNKKLFMIFRKHQYVISFLLFPLQEV